MKKTFIKNALLIGSGIAIATSFAIYAQPAQLGTSIQANLVNLVQYLGQLHITSDGTPQGDSVLHIDGSGNFLQTRQQDNIQYGLLNDPSIFGMPYVGAMSSSGDYNYFAGIENLPGGGLLSVVGSMNLASGWVNYLGANDQGISMSHVSQVGVSDSDNSIFIDGSGIQFSFIGASNKYRFPTNPGQANQVLTTHGNGQLSWEDVAGGGSTSYQALGMTEIQGADSLIHLDLSTVGTFVSEFQVHYNDNLQSIDLSHLTNAYGSEFYIGDNHNLISLDLSSLDTTEKLHIYRDSLTSVDISSLTYAGQIKITYGSDQSGYPVNNLTQIIIGSNLKCLDIDFSNNALTQENIDDILAKLDAAGYTGGNLSIGGTNGYPSAAGLASIANLEAKERYISYNTEPEPE